MDPQQVINESRPMLEQFFADIGISEAGGGVANARLLGLFSDWIDAQEIAENDVGYVVARVGAFVCEYLIDQHSAVRFIDGETIKLRLPIDASKGVFREFDPYAIALQLVRGRQSLKKFLSDLRG